jgi:hypothetical protein
LATLQVFYGLISLLLTTTGFFFDVLVQSVKMGSRVRMVTMPDQKIPQGLFVSCSKSLRDHYPVGSIFQLNCCIIRSNNRKPFIRPLRYHHVALSLYFFEHNRKLQATYHTQLNTSLFNTTT